MSAEHTLYKVEVSRKPGENFRRVSVWTGGTEDNPRGWTYYEYHGDARDVVAAAAALTQAIPWVFVHGGAGIQGELKPLRVNPPLPFGTIRWAAWSSTPAW
jgi:hypothetical protein